MAVDMFRKLRSITLLTVVLWHSLALLGSWSVSQQIGDLEHLIVHYQNANHHHHTDNTLHMDDEGGPVQHVHTDAGNSSIALLTSQPAALADVRSMSPPDTTYAAWLSPTLEGPLRPPMQPA
jgi:hypothetical protein